MAAREPYENFPEEVESDRDIRPLSERNSRNSGLIFIAAAVIGVLLLLFFQLTGNNEPEVQVRDVVRPSTTEVKLPEIEPPKPQVVEVQPVAPAQPRINPLELERLMQLAKLEEERRQAELRRLEEEREERQRRYRSDLLKYNGGSDSPDDAQSEALNAALKGLDQSGGGFNGFGGDETSSNQVMADRNNRFLRDAGNEDVVKARAVKLPNQRTLITQGTIISGILETAINSDLPGMTRALVDKPVYSRTGEFVVIPKGSRLIGRYQSGIETGQTRVFVVWTRVERPDGVVVDLDSPGTDPLGSAGLGGNVDTHFFKRFGSAALFSTIGPLIAILADEDNQNQQTREIISSTRSDFENASGIILKQNIGIPPTIRVPQGNEISIFVNRDLSFDAVDLPAQ